jgi:RNA polymerase sigma factor (sigma-70 family)
MSQNSGSPWNTPSDEHDRETLRLLLNPQPSIYERGVQRMLERYGSSVAHALKISYRGLLSEDDSWSCVNEALFKAWRSSHDFDPEKGTLGAWLFRIAQRAAIDMLRGPGWRQHPQSLGDFDPPYPLDGETTAWSEELVAALARAIDDLPPLQQSIIEADLAAGTEADDSSLAKRHKTSENSIRVSRYKARANLREWFRQHGYKIEESW